MKGLDFRSSLAEKPPSPQQQLTDIRSILPPPPNVYFRRPPSHPDNNIYIAEQSVPKEVKKIITQVENNESISILDVLILLRRGKELTKYNKDRLNNGILCCYLGIMYYKTGLLEQAFQQFLIADTAIKQHSEAKKLSKHMQSSETEQSFIALILESKWLKIRGRIHLQLCILLSEIERHEHALKHAQLGIKILYEVAVNYFIITRGFILNRSMNSKLHSYFDSINVSQKSTHNLLSITNKLIDTLKDIKYEYLSKQKITQLDTQNGLAQTYDIDIDEPNIQQFMKEVVLKSKWVVENKILNQVQMELLNKNQYMESVEINSNDVVEVVVFLSVGFYCLSTESRFLEKQSKLISYNHVMESQNWLSRALELAYVFLPAQSPILGQIYSVHDKFYGLGKQPIPEDGEIGGNIKFLKQMRKVSSIYDKKAMTLCVPILIRTNPISQISPQKQTHQSTISSSKHVKMRSMTIDLNQQRFKSHSKRNSLQKIYRKNGRKLIKASKASSSLQHHDHRSRDHDDLPRFQPSQLRPLSTQIGFSKLTRLINPKIDIQINNNINLFVSNPNVNRSFDDKFISLQQRDGEKEKRLGLLNNRKVILKLIPGVGESRERKGRDGRQGTTGKRSIYHIKRKSMGAKDLELSEL